MLNVKCLFVKSLQLWDRCSLQGQDWRYSAMTCWIVPKFAIDDKTDIIPLFTEESTKQRKVTMVVVWKVSRITIGRNDTKIRYKLVLKMIVRKKQIFYVIRYLLQHNNEYCTSTYLSCKYVFHYLSDRIAANLSALTFVWILWFAILSSSNSTSSRPARFDGPM